MSRDRFKGGDAGLGLSSGDRDYIQIEDWSQWLMLRSYPVVDGMPDQKFHQELETYTWILDKTYQEPLRSVIIKALQEPAAMAELIKNWPIGTGYETGIVLGSGGRQALLRDAEGNFGLYEEKEISFAGVPGSIRTRAIPDMRARHHPGGSLFALNATIYGIIFLRRHVVF